MWPDRVSNPGSLTYESGALPIAVRGPAEKYKPFTIGFNSKRRLKNIFDMSSFNTL